MGLLDLVPGVAPAKLIGYGLAALAIIGAVTYGVHRYNEWIRAPIRAEVTKLEGVLKDVDNQLAANKREAKRLLDAEIAANQVAAENWRNHVKETTNDYEKQLAQARARRDANVGSGVVFHDPGKTGRGNGDCRAQAAAEGSAGLPANPAAAGRLSDEAAQFLSNDIAYQADLAALYAARARADALKCIRGEP